MTSKQISEMEIATFINIICGYNGKQLMNFYDFLCRNFNPADFDLCDKYEILRKHIVESIDWCRG